MSRKYTPAAAEKEANEIGLKFANSNDVVRDMSRAYHTDFSSVKIHTDMAADSRVKAAGKDALAVGNDLFFGKGIFESNDPASKGLVAHELAHTMQQGAVAGGYMDMGVSEYAPMGTAQGGLLEMFKTLIGRRPENKVRFARDKRQTPKGNLSQFWNEGLQQADRWRANGITQREDLHEVLDARFTPQRLSTNMQNAGSGDEKVSITGLSMRRMIDNLQGALGGDMTNEQIGDMYANLLSGHDYAKLAAIKPENRTPEQQAAFDAYTPEQVAGMNAQFAEGFSQLKGVYLAQMRRVREKYGTYLTEMHPEDFVQRIGPEVFDDFSFMQDTAQMLADGSRFFDLENNADDKEFQLLNQYYGDGFNTITGYMMARDNPDYMNYVENSRDVRDALAAEEHVKNPAVKGFTEKQHRSYLQRIRKRFQKDSLRHRLFGRFKNTANNT